MARILVIDRLESTHKLVDFIVKRHFSDMKLSHVAGVRKATQQLNKHKIKLILAEIDPDKQDYSLFDHLAEQQIEIPVLAMCSEDSREIAWAAITRGAVGFIPKKQLSQKLPLRIQTTLNALNHQRSTDVALEFINNLNTTLHLPNDRTLVADIVTYSQQLVHGFGLISLAGQTRIGIALEEALVNAMIHGNLEIKSDLRGVDDEAYIQLLNSRLSDVEYNQRKVTYKMKITPEDAEFIIEDEGPGFDVKNIPDPTDPENMGKASGRGLLMIRSFMDHVEHNEKGNRITMIKHKQVDNNFNSNSAIFRHLNLPPDLGNTLK